MSDTAEQLNIVIAADETPLDRSLTSGVRLLDGFVRAVEGGANRIASAIDRSVEGSGSLTRIVQSGLGRLVTALESVDDRLRRTGGGASGASSEVAKLNAQFRAGVLDQEAYKAALRATADAAEQGSATQLAALGRLRAVEGQEAAEARRIADEKARDARRVADEQGRQAKRAADEHAKQARAATDAWKRMADDTLRSASRLGDILTRTATPAVLFGGLMAVRQAGNLREAIDMVDTVFQESAGTVQAWSKTTAEALGTSRREALQTAGTLGALLTTKGVSKSDAVDAAIKAVKQGVDLASLYNRKTDEAMRAIQSGLNGEEEPLRKFGVSLSAVRIEAEAYAIGLAKPVASMAKIRQAQIQAAEASAKAAAALRDHGEGSFEYAKAQNQVELAEERLKKAMGGSKVALDARQKALAALSIITKDSKPADDNYNKTRDSLNNTEKRAAATAENLAAQIGEHLVPAKKLLLEIGLRWLKAFNDLDPAQQRFTLWLIAAAAAAGPLLKVLTGGIEATMGLGRAILFLRGLKFAELIGQITTAWRAAKVATDGATAAQAAMSASGAAAFAAGAPLMLGLIAVTALVAGLAIAWGKVKDAEAEAEQKARDYDAAAKEIAARGPKHALGVERQQVAQQQSDVKTRIEETRRQLQAVEGRIAGDAKAVGDGTRPRGTPRFGRGPGDDRIVDDSAAAVPNLEADTAAAAVRAGRVSEANNLRTLLAQLQKQDADLTKKSADLKKRYEALPKDGAKKPPPPKKDDAGTGTGSGTDNPVPDAPVPGPKNKAATSYLSRVPIRSFDFRTDAELMAAPTDAANYDDKGRAMDEAAARSLLEKRQKGLPVDEYATEASRLSQRMLLAGDAIRATTAEIDRLAPKLGKDKTAYEDAGREVNRYTDLLNSKTRAGQKVSAEEKRHLSALRQTFRGAQIAYDADQKAYQQNAAVRAKAVADRTRDMDALGRLEEAQSKKAEERALRDQQIALKKGAITRGQYEEWLRGAMAAPDLTEDGRGRYGEALGESEAGRASSDRDLRRKTLRMDGRDFEALREELAEEVAAFRAAGADETEVVAYEAARREEIRRAESDKTRQDLTATHRAALEAGTETAAQYRDFLVGQLRQVQEVYGRTSAEAAKLSLEITRLDWQAIDDEATGFREALDQGDISLHQYIRSLERLRSGVGEASAEYRKLTREIDQANRKMISDARRTGDEVGDRFADGLMSVVKRTRSLGGMVRDTLSEIGEGIARDFIKRTISKLIFRVVMESNAQKMDRAAQLQNQAADKMLRAAQTQASGAGASGGGVGGAAGTVGGGTLSTINAGLNTASSAASGDVVGAATSAASAGWLGKAALKAVPYVGAALAAYSLVSALIPKQKPDYVTRMGEGRYSAIGDGDHTGLIDSGYSGAEGMRRIQAQQQAALARAKASRPVVQQMASGAVQINVQTQPGQSPQQFAEEMWRVFQERTAMSTAMNDALEGSE